MNADRHFPVIALANPTCTHFLPPGATIKEQNPRGQQIFVRELQLTVSVVLAIFFNVKHMLTTASKCRTVDIDQPRRQRSYDRSMTDRLCLGRAAAWPALGEAAGGSRTAAAHDASRATSVPIAGPLARTAAFYAVGMTPRPQLKPMFTTT